MTTKPEEVTLTDNERQRVECWTRVMGYHRPVSSFNVGKRQEFEDRKPFTMAAAAASPYAKHPC